MMTPITALMLFTLSAAVAVAVTLYVRHMRTPQNRHPLKGKRDRNMDEIKQDAGERSGRAS